VLFDRENILIKYVDQIIAKEDNKNLHLMMNISKREIRLMEMDIKSQLKYLKISNQEWRMFVNYKKKEVFFLLFHHLLTKYK
jgi:hypothetical protein